MVSKAMERALDLEQMHGNAVFQLRYAKKRRTWTALFMAKPGKTPFFYKASNADKEKAIEQAIQAFIRVAKAAEEKRKAEEEARRLAEEAEKAELKSVDETVTEVTDEAREVIR